MAGRKQHYIPQHLLRGFKASQSGKHVQVVVYTKEKRSFASSTGNIAAERYFYSSQEDELDDAITRYEQEKLNRGIDYLRLAPDGLLVDTEAVAEAVVHLTVRAAHTRGSFEQLFQGMMSEFENIADNQDLLRLFCEIDCSETDSTLFQEIGKALAEVRTEGLNPGSRSYIERIVRYIVRSKFDIMMPDFLPAVRENLSKLAGDFPRMVERAQLKALHMSLAPSARVVQLKSMYWWVVSAYPPFNFILPDCVAIAADDAGQMQPYILQDDSQISVVAMPVSADKVLIGSIKSEPPDVTNLNAHFARCSLSFFVSSCEGGALQALTPLIGEAVGRSAVNLAEGTPSSAEPAHQFAACSDNTATPRIRVEFESSSYKSARLIHAVWRAVAEQCDDHELDLIEAVRVVPSIATEISRIHAPSLLDYEVATATGGAVEVLAAASDPRFRIIMPERTVQLLMARDVCAIKAAEASIRALLEQLRHYRFWFEKICPSYREDGFSERRRFSLDLAYRFFPRAYSIWIAAPFVSLKTILDGEAESRSIILLSIQLIFNERLAFMLHGDRDTLINGLSIALHVLFCSAAAYCICCAIRDVHISSDLRACQEFSETGLLGWLELFGRDLRIYMESISQGASTLASVSSLAEHAEYVLWHFGIFIFDESGGQMRIEIKGDRVMHILYEKLGFPHLS